MVMEKGMPNEGRVTIRRKAGAVYDLVRHERIPHRTLPNGDTEIDVRYQTNDGKVFLVAVRPLGKLQVDVAGDGIRVTSPDRDVMVPITIAIDGEPDRHAVVADGSYIWRRPRPSASIRVFNQADGSIATPSH